jgi:2-keto-3-deoxy-L-rhamnonate aldolase RhmA
MNTTKQLLREGGRAVGCFIFLGDPAVVEIAGLAGMDFVIVDMEHSPRDIWLVEQMVRAAEVVGITPLVRVSENSEKTILRVLETGAQGVVLPILETGEAAAEAVRAIRYPPLGARGTCTVTRASRYGIFRPAFNEYTSRSNDETLVVGLIESVAGVENIREILAAGIDIAFVGRGDLSASFGIPGEKEDPRVVRAMEDVVAAVREHRSTTKVDCWAGMTPYVDPDSNSLVTLGCEFIVQQVDAYALLDTWRTGIAQTRATFPHELESR